jgi:hypothetical protein
MGTAEYVFMKDMTHSAAVLDLMHLLYAEDNADSGVDESLFPQTLHKLLTQPQAGRIVLLCVREKVQGYALLIPYWSNEYGGYLVYVDELYVMAEAPSRSRERPLSVVSE